jgi:hypothetical protein
LDLDEKLVGIWGWHWDVVDYDFLLDTGLCEMDESKGRVGGLRVPLAGFHFGVWKWIYIIRYGVVTVSTVLDGRILMCGIIARKLRLVW